MIHISNIWFKPCQNDFIFEYGDSTWHRRIQTSVRHRLSRDTPPSSSETARLALLQVGPVWNTQWMSHGCFCATPSHRKFSRQNRWPRSYWPQSYQSLSQAGLFCMLSFSICIAQPSIKWALISKYQTISHSVLTNGIVSNHNTPTALSIGGRWNHMNRNGNYLRKG